jgi:Putative bacterial sensory transduction regulator
MQSPPASPEELAALERRIGDWLAAEAAQNPVIDAVERSDHDVIRWFVRVLGEEKDVWTVWLTLRQRTLRFETYVMPAPEENHARFFEHLLRRNHKLTGLGFEIGDEDAVFLAGSLPVAAVNEAELDRILGSMWAAVEQCFKPALRLGFTSRVGDDNRG